MVVDLNLLASQHLATMHNLCLWSETVALKPVTFGIWVGARPCKKIACFRVKREDSPLDLHPFFNPQMLEHTNYLMPR